MDRGMRRWGGLWVLGARGSGRPEVEGVFGGKNGEEENGDSIVMVLLIRFQSTRQVPWTA